MPDEGASRTQHLPIVIDAAHGLSLDIARRLSDGMVVTMPDVDGGP
jgi:hypothetical protein